MKSKGIIINGDRTQLIVDNIKCGGCAHTITKALQEIGFTNVSVFPEQSLVNLDSPKEPATIAAAVEKLKALGYPLIETEKGLKAAALRAKSYVSCALGKLG